MKKIVFFLLLCAAAGAQGAVYECLQNGKTVYTNKKSAYCKNAVLGDIGSYSNDNSAYAHIDLGTRSPSSSSGKSTVKSATRSGTAAERVPPSVQARRDQGRIDILQRELSNEKQALNDAMRRLAAGRAAKQTPAQISALENAVKDRQENINALQKEISRM